MLINKNEINYSKYDLVRNPFPYIGVPGESSIFSNRSTEIQNIENIFRGFRQNHNSCFLALVAAYGNGKTATMLHINSHLKSFEDTFSIYVPNPGKTFLEFYTNLISAIGLKSFEILVWNYLEQNSKIKNLRSDIEKGRVLLSKIIEEFKSNLPDHFYADFSNAMLNLIFEETRSISWRFLCGENILPEERRLINVSHNLNTDEKALKSITTLKEFLKKAGIIYLTIFVDEFESIGINTIQKRQKLLNDFRRLIDNLPSGLTIMISCTPDIWNLIIKEYHAFSDRISREIILLPLSEKSIKKVITDYLDVYRTSKSEPKTKYNSIKENAEQNITKDIEQISEYTHYHPFTDDFIKELLKEGNGNIRRILTTCGNAIDTAAISNLPIIDSTILDKIKSFPISGDE